MECTLDKYAKHTGTLSTQPPKEEGTSRHLVTKYCAILIQCDRLNDLGTRQLQAMPDENDLQPPRAAEDIQRECRRENRIAAATNGVCSHHGHSRLRSSSARGFFGHHYSKNFSLTVRTCDGSAQTNDLVAFVQLLGRTWETPQILTDSALLLRG